MVGDAGDASATATPAGGSPWRAPSLTMLIAAASLLGVSGCALDRTGLNIVVGDGGDPDGQATDGAGPGDDAADGASDPFSDAPASDRPTDTVPDAPGEAAVDVAVDRAPDVGKDVAADLPPDLAIDLAPDLPVDLRLDRTADIPGDTRVDLGSGNDVMDVAVDRACPGTFHRCGESCVSNSSLASCGPTSCVPCPTPANGDATCDGLACGAACDPNFSPQGSSCFRCDQACNAGAVTVTLPGARFSGTTSGVSANTGSCGGASSPEAVYRLTLTATSDVFVTTHGTDFDTVVYMRRGCCGPEIACNDDANGRSDSVLNATAVPPGTYDIFIDGAGGDEGMFTVDIFASPTSTKPGESCGRPMRISTAAISGDTCGYRDDDDPITPGCLPGLGNSGGVDAVFYFVLDGRSTVTFDTCSNTCFDSALYVRDVCASAPSERGCVHQTCGATTGGCASPMVQSKISVLLEAGVHYLFLDTNLAGPAAPTCGAFTVTPAGIGP